MPPKIDLKKVGQLYKDTIAAIRDKAPTVEALEPQAIDWLKAARYKLMRQLEARRATILRTSPHTWIPQSLQLTTDPVPKSLSPYSIAFQNNLRGLMTDCGFQNCIVSLPGPQWGIYISINFPTLLLPPPPLQTLHVEDEFSRSARGGSEKDDKAAVGTFTATNFGRLLIDARGESGAPHGNASGSRKRRRAASPEIKEEGDADGGGRRLRSTTRATSSATLRSDGGNTRRSGRNRIKREE